MRYYESREQSAELLRMVLPLMSKHSAGFHPLSYAVWYEYVAGTNHSLKSALEQRIAGGRLLGEEDVKELFDAFVAVRDIESSMRIRGAIQKVVERVNNATARAASDVDEYSKELSRYQQQLEGPLERDAINAVVASLRGGTNRIQERTDDFGQQLVQTNAEVNELGVQLEHTQGLSLHDPLTGLLNQRGFERHTRQQLAAGLKNNCLVLIDVDNVQQLIEAHGNLLGDRIIGAVGQAVKMSFDAVAEPARVANRQFAALLEATTPASAAELAEKLRSVVERGRIKRQDKDESIGGVTVSIGVAAYVDGEGWESLLHRAAHAQQRSQQSGGNRVTVAAAD